MASTRTQAWPSIRISASQLELLVADLDPLHWVMLRVLGIGFPDAPCFDRGPAAFEDCHIFVKRLWKRLHTLKSGPKQKRYRLKLDVFEVALCIRALRAPMRKRGLLVPHSNIPNTPLVRRRRLELLRRLENYERVLRRRIHQLRDDSRYVAEPLDRYVRYFKLLIHELFRPVLGKPRGLQIRRRQMFESLVTIAEESFKGAGGEIPPDKQLRKLISQWIQDVLRYRSDVTISTLLENPSAGKEPLLRYIQRRWARINPAPPDDLSTRLSRVGEALRRVMPDLDDDD